MQRQQIAPDLLRRTHFTHRVSNQLFYFRGIRGTLDRKRVTRSPFILENPLVTSNPVGVVKNNSAPDIWADRTDQVPLNDQKYVLRDNRAGRNEIRSQEEGVSNTRKRRKPSQGDAKQMRPQRHVTSCHVKSSSATVPPSVTRIPSGGKKFRFQTFLSVPIPSTFAETSSIPTTRTTNQ